jgi:hypothetical protein
MPPSRYFMSAISIEHELGRPITVTDLEGRFRRNYNRVNFMFKHELAGNSLFELESLVELTRRMPDHGEHYWATGEVPVNNTWSDGTIGRQSLRDTILNIEHNNSTVVLRHTEQDPVFAPVLQSVLTTIIELSGEQMRSDVKIGEVTILVSSPARIATYHMESATNFLLQITGDKWFHIFDHSDRTLVTDRELEDFFAFNRHRELVRTDRRDECVKHDLRAGYGVHVPTCAPHWTRNREHVSVALSVNYELRSVERLEKLYRFNHRLRKLGLSPAAPNVSGWRDRIKLAAADGMAAMRVVGKQREGRPYQVWTPPAD